METLSFLVLVSIAAAGPLSLDDALALAARRNADLQIARADADTAQVGLRASYQGVLPRLDLSAAAGHEYAGEQQQLGVTPVVTIPRTDFGLYQYGLNFSWTLFDGLGSWDRIASSRSQSDAAARQYDESTLRVSFEVIRRFYEVVRQQRNLEVRRQAAELSAELVKRADALFTAGRGTRADTYNARVNLGNDQLAVRAQSAALVQARSDLAVVLGLPSEAGLEVQVPAVVSGNEPPPAQELPALSNLLARAREARPLLGSLRLSGRAADQEVARARAAYWPVLGFQLSYQRQAERLNGSFGLFGDSSRQYTATAQVTLGLNIFAGGETRAGVDRAEVQARRSQAVVEQGEETVAAEVTTAREQAASLSDSVATIQEVLDAAEKGLRAARDRLEAGVGSQLEVRDASLKLSQARLTWVSTVIDLVVARADLNRAVGGGL